MPVFWFALSQINKIDPEKALLIFFILHVLVYPASNGYNSFMDRDTESVGGIKNPLPPTQQLLYVTIFLDAMAIALSLTIGFCFAAGILFYILASKAYSYRKIRLKKYPVSGFLLVTACQGSLIFYLVMIGSSQFNQFVPVTGIVGSALLVGSFYPLTQIYQHKQDKADGVKTLSYILGYKGTFVFSALIFLFAMIMIRLCLLRSGKADVFLQMQIFFIPVLVYFGWWFSQVFKNTGEANFKNTMRMNVLASIFTNMAFIYLLLTNRY
jgi:1,4-dihydroxy-2-naphthoate octaprenyltransferase